MRRTESFIIKPQFKSVDAARKIIKGVLGDWLGSVDDEKSDEFCQIISELANNAVEHGMCECIDAELRLEDEWAFFTLTTDGVPFDSTVPTAGMPVPDETNELPEGGYGLAIIRHLADIFTYRNVNGKNVTIVGKQFCKKSQGGENGDQGRS